MNDLRTQGPRFESYNLQPSLELSCQKHSWMDVARKKLSLVLLTGAKTSLNKHEDDDDDDDDNDSDSDDDDDKTKTATTATRRLHEELF